MRTKLMYIEFEQEKQERKRLKQKSVPCITREMFYLGTFGACIHHD